MASQPRLLGLLEAYEYLEKQLQQAKYEGNNDLAHMLVAKLNDLMCLIDRARRGNAMAYSSYDSGYAEKSYRKALDKSMGHWQCESIVETRNPDPIGSKWVAEVEDLAPDAVELVDGMF